MNRGDREGSRVSDLVIVVEHQIKEFADSGVIVDDEHNGRAFSATEASAGAHGVLDIPWGRAACQDPLTATMRRGAVVIVAVRVLTHGR